MIPFATLLLIFFIYASRNLKSSSLEVLHQKFRKGKISEQEYEKTKRLLEKEKDLKSKMFFLSSLSGD
jgi:uncharacterized membrane protein